MSSLFDMASLMQSLNIKKSETPFVGLRPFEADESHLFFGRDKQIADLLQKLHNHQFLAIVGSSGCGKSSLIRAGLIPQLKAGFLTEKRDYWIIATLRPSGDPLLHFCNAINDAFNSSMGDVVLGNPNLTPDGLIEACVSGFIKTMHDLMDSQRVNLLILVDQFEELFTYKTGNEKQKNDNSFFVNLLMTLAAEKELPVYTVITMRSDYIGHCNRFFGLPELLNESQYLVPRLKWQQIREVIESPIKLFGQEINPGLLDLLTNDSDKELDQLPVLQHCLMRTYQNWIKDGKKGLVEFRHYEKTGGLSGALCNHANAVFDKLDINEKFIAKYMFQAISDYNAEYEPVRRPQPFGSILNICMTVEGCRKEDILNVINQFREKSCAFLTPSESVKNITDETIIDISHESLMRQWDRLNEWIKSEQRSSEKLYWLSEAVTNQREYLRGWDIKDAKRWEETQKPNRAWAERYVDNLPGVIEYIDKSNRNDRKRKLFFYGSISLATLAIITTLVGFSNLKKQKALSALKETESKLAKAETDAEAERNIASFKLKADSNETALLRAKAARDSLEKAEHLAIDKIEEQKAEAAVQNEIIRKTNSIRNEAMAKVLELTKEKFYQSPEIDPEIKKRYVLELIKIRYEEQIGDKIGNEPKFQKFLKSLNKASEGMELVKSNPNIGLWMIGNAYQTYKLPAFDSIFTSQMDKYLFYSLASDFQLSNTNENSANNLVSAISNKKDLFAFRDNNTIKLLKITPDTIKLQASIIIPEGINRRSRGYENSKIKVRLFFKDDNTLLGLINDSIVYNWNQEGKQVNKWNVGTTTSYQVKEISQDGNWLFLGNFNANESQIKIKNIVKQSDSIIYALPDTIGVLSSIKVSPDNKKYLLNGFRGISMGSLDNTLKLNTKEFISGNFINNNYILAQPNRDTGNTNANNKNRRFQLIKTNFSNTENSNEIDLSREINPDEEVLETYLSQDWQKLLIQLQNSAMQKFFIVVEKSSGDSVFEFKSKRQKNVNNFIVKKVNNSTASGFLKNELIVAGQPSNNLLRVSLWKKYNKFNVADVCAENMPPLSDFNKVKYEILNIDNVKGENRLKAIKEESEQSYYITGDPKDIDIKNEVLKTLSKNFGSIYWSELAEGAQFFDGSDTLQYCNDLKDIIKLGEKLLAKTDKNEVKDIKLDLSTLYGQLSFLSMFNPKIDYDSVIFYASRGLELDSVFNDWIYTNQALGYLFSGNYNKAYSLYRRFKDSLYGRDDKRPFNEGFLGDLNDLEDAGIITPRKADLYERVRKIRKFLKNEIATLD